MGKHYELGDENQFIHDLYNSPELCAQDMENGSDGVDGIAPEFDTPEKDDRDAQPPVDTDNR